MFLLSIGDVDGVFFNTFCSLADLGVFDAALAAGFAAYLGVFGFFSFSLDLELFFFGGMSRRWGIDIE